MSDLHELREKVEAGAAWRGTVEIDMDGEVHELTVRQLRDPELWRVRSLIDQDDVESLQESIDDEKRKEYRELLDDPDADEERVAELEAELEASGEAALAQMSEGTYEGITKAAKYGVEPDEQDIRDALVEHGDEIEADVGRSDNEAAREWLNEHYIHPMVERCTEFTSVALGLKVLEATSEDEGK